MWRVSAVLLAAGLVCGMAVWWSRAGNPAAPYQPVVGAEGAGESHRDIEPSSPAVGSSLTGDITPDTSAGILQDSIVVASCSLVPVGQQDVSSQVDGVFREVLVDLGQQVTRGQLLGRLDDRQLRPQVDLLEVRAASRAAELIAKAQHDEADQRVEYAVKANKSGLRSVSELEYQTYFFQRERYAQEMQKAREEQQAARKELERARHMLDLHEIRSGLAGEVVKVYKRDGEAVKQMEPLFRVANCDRLRIEGLCKVHQADLIRVGMRVLVEPEQPSERLRELKGHTAAVTAVAVAPDGRWVASASEDHTVILWAWPSATRHAVLPHPAEVHALAFARAGESTSDGFLLATGSADGVLRFWSLSAAGEVKGPRVCPSGHEGALRAVAFSLDGRSCATGGEDRRIGLWDVASGRRVSWVGGDGQAEGLAHQGAVTWLQFLPDRHLVSTGRDNTLQVWRITADGSRLVGSQPGRTGEVSTLGVSSDGRCVLFDQGEELRILDRATWSTLGSLRSRRQGRFQGFSLFSPSNRMILAAASNGRLQLWKTPAVPAEANFLRQAYLHGLRRNSLLAVGLLGGGVPPFGDGAVSAFLAANPSTGKRNPLPQMWGVDGYEIKHLLSPSATTATCGAFAPDESVVFTGASDGAVRVWAVPPHAQWNQPWEATITFVDTQVEPGTDGTRIRAEMENSTLSSGRLRPGTYADLRIYPETALAQ